MPRVRPGQKQPPVGFDLVNDELDQFEDAMRNAMHATPLAHAKPTLIARKPSDATPKAGALKPGKDNMSSYLASMHKEYAYSSSESDGEDSQSPVETNSAPKASVGAQDTTTPRDEEGIAKGEGEAEEADGVDAPSDGPSSDPFAAVVAETPPMWTVARINRERTRFVYDMHYKQNKISREVLDYCCEMNFVDAGLVRRWRVPGYERLCCVHCAAPGVASGLTSSTNCRAVQSKKTQRHGSRESVACICRVPRAQRRQSLVACMVCGCSGCCSGDTPDPRTRTPTSRKEEHSTSDPAAQHGEEEEGETDGPSSKRTRTEH